MSANDVKLKEGYKIAQCCSPSVDDVIIGYYSYNNVLVIHKPACDSLKKIEPERLVSLSWQEILEREEEKPEEDYQQLDEIDFRILQHHKEMGADYSWMVAYILKMESELVFERHKKLRDSKLLKRVEPAMIQYRKNIVENKWIKHRNHTYYQITPKGEKYLNLFLSQKDKR